MPQPNLIGAVGFSGPTKNASFFQKAVMFFTSSRWSHSFIITFPDSGEDMVLEASREVQKVPLCWYRQSPDCAYELYTPIGTTSDAIRKALHFIEGEYLGERYGYLQLLYFVWRWLNRKILGRSIGREANWFPEGKICSEVTYDYQAKLAEETRADLPIVMFADFSTYAKEYGFSENTVSPQDLYLIVKDHPEMFSLVEGKSA